MYISLPAAVGVVSGVRLRFRGIQLHSKQIHQTRFGCRRRLRRDVNLWTATGVALENGSGRSQEHYDQQMAILFPSACQATTFTHARIMCKTEAGGKGAIAFEI